MKKIFLYDVTWDLKMEKKKFGKKRAPTRVDRVIKDHGTHFTICSTGTDDSLLFL